MNVGRAHERRIDGVRVHAVEWPAPAAARRDDRRVLLVHGLGANTISWTPVAQLLAEQLGADVTAIDLVGFGRTRALDREATIATNRSLVEGLLDDTGPALVIGNSMGAVIGAGVAARRPELVDALVLVNPALPWGRVGPAAWWRLAKLAPLMMPSLGRRAVSARARVIGPERLVDLTLEMCVHDRSRIDPTLRQRLVHLAAERYAYPEAAGAYADAARSLLRELASGSADRDLGRACALVPTLLAHGEHDRLVCVDLAHAAALRHPGLDVEVLHGVGHAPQLEVPDRLVEVVAAWLDARMGPWQAERPGRRARATVPASSGSPSGSSSTI
jgi:pimeloyl-ACP methyl ester carboxylesterase